MDYCLFLAYGDVGVEHIGPRYGPMNGNERVYALLKGRILKNDLVVYVKEDTTGWYQQLPYTKNGNLIYFTMPSFPYPSNESVLANVFICYKGEDLCQSSYIYKMSLDRK